MEAASKKASHKKLGWIDSTGGNFIPQSDDGVPRTRTTQWSADAFCRLESETASLARRSVMEDPPGIFLRHTKMMSIRRWRPLLSRYDIYLPYLLWKTCLATSQIMRFRDFESQRSSPLFS